MTTLSPEEKQRYERQIIMPGIGADGQERLKKSRVFVAGLGGLGSVSSFYMAAAGAGFLKTVDMDVVEVGNLNRQILHGTADIARPKARSAFEKLKGLNPCCDVTALAEEITGKNVCGLLEDSDIILDATDNIETRKLLNLASVKKKIPYIYGGIDGFFGMVSTFIPGKTPCLECLFPGRISKKEEREKIGAIGPVPGIVASVQSMEAIKYLTGMEEGLLKNILLYIDARDMTFKRIDLEKDPGCPVCGS